MKKIINLLLIGGFYCNPSLADFNISYKENDKFQLIEFEGSILFHHFSTKISQVVEKIHSDKNIVLFVRDSLGGDRYAFTKMAERIKDRIYSLRGQSANLTIVFEGFCASSCTFLPFLADTSIALLGTYFGFHRTWIIHPKLTIHSPKQMAEFYTKLGGNERWFHENAELIFSDEHQLKGYWVESPKDHIESGLVSMHMDSFDEFYENY